MKDLIESDKSSEEIVNNLTEGTDKRTIISTIEANGLGPDDYEYEDQGKASTNADTDVSVNVYTDEGTFNKIIGDLQSQGVKLNNFAYKSRDNYGWFAPIVS